MIHKEESDLAHTFRGFCWQTYIGWFSLKESHSCIYAGIFVGLPVLDLGLFSACTGYLNQSSSMSEPAYVTSSAISVLIKVFDFCFFIKMMAVLCPL